MAAAIFWNIGNSELDGPRWRINCHFFPAESDLACVSRRQAEQHASQLRPARPDEPCQADDFARANRKIDSMDDTVESIGAIVTSATIEIAAAADLPKLADACLANGKYRHALSEYRRTLADRERALGPDHLDTIATRAALGSACHAAGRMAAAIRFYEETRADYERVLGADHQDTLASCVNLAQAYQEAGRVTDALALLRDALARCERSGSG